MSQPNDKFSGARDPLGARIKENYENRTRFLLPRRSHTILRADGKAWHSFCRKLNKPFDMELIADYDAAIINTLKHLQGAQFAYVQSDECSVLLTDFEKENSDAWFDGNIQKMTSVSASILTAEFNRCRVKRIGVDAPLAFFDARVFTIPDPIEVYNYFIWRWKDCSRNSVSMVAQSLYPHKELQNKSTSALQEMIFQKGINWAKYDESLKNGRFIIKETYQKDGATRSHWVVVPAWKLTADPDKLKSMIPKYPA